MTNFTEPLKASNIQVHATTAAIATVSAHSSTATLAESDFGKNNTNTGAGGATVMTLPAAALVRGSYLKYQLTVAQQVSLSPAATDAVYLGGSGVLNKDLIIAGVVGNFVEIYSNGADYEVVNYSGVVTKEA